MKTTRWLTGCLLAAGLIGLSVTQARAAHPDLQTTTAGMLTFYAVAEVESPTDTQVVASPHTFVNNPTTPEADRNHKVKITGPANSGGINIDYALEFEIDGINMVGSTSITDTTAGLNGSGLWIVNPVYSASLSVTTGQHTVIAWSYIKYRPSGTSASKAHVHAFSH
jgi:hypothetical protein